MGKGLPDAEGEVDLLLVQRHIVVQGEDGVVLDLVEGLQPVRHFQLVILEQQKRFAIGGLGPAGLGRG